jgi:uncharacterized membrane protein
MSAPEAALYRLDGETFRKDAPILVLLALDVVFGLVMWTFMPLRVPIHWGASGKIDGWGPAWVNALVLPGITVLAYLLFLTIPLIDPLRRNYGAFGGSLRFLRLIVVAFLVLVHVLVVVASMGVAVPMDVAIRGALPLLFAGIGTRLASLKHNWFFGIRTPWTLANEEVWTRTHRLGGTLWTVGGLLLVPCALLPPRPGLAVLVAGIVVLALVPVVYSAVLYKRLTP